MFPQFHKTCHVISPFTPAPESHGGTRESQESGSNVTGNFQLVPPRPLQIAGLFQENVLVASWGHAGYTVDFFCLSLIVKPTILSGHCVYSRKNLCKIKNPKQTNNLPTLLLM